MKNYLAMILQGGQVISILLPITLEVALKLKALFTQISPDTQVEIRAMQATAVQNADETIVMIDTWMKENEGK